MECFAIDQVELEEDQHLEGNKFLLGPEDPERSVDPETQARLEALLEAAGIGKLSSADGKHLADHEVFYFTTANIYLVDYFILIYFVYFLFFSLSTGIEAINQ